MTARVLKEARGEKESKQKKTDWRTYPHLFKSVRSAAKLKALNPADTGCPAIHKYSTYYVTFTAQLFSWDISFDLEFRSTGQQTITEWSLEGTCLWTVCGTVLEYKNLKQE